jgi:hypothetical protein
MRSISALPGRSIRVLSALVIAMIMSAGCAMSAFGAPTVPTALSAGIPALAAPMTDAQLSASDPAGYRDVISTRAAVERELLGKVHKALDARGLAYGRTLTASELAAVEAAVSTVYSPYGYLRFGLVAGTGDWSYNGYRGTLYFTYGIYNATVDAYKWYTVSWPAISGNNRPSDQDVPNVGPVPEYTWDFGFLGSTWQGYVSNAAAEFYPGEWRLSPWTGAPYGRCYFETHGGSGTHYFKPTHGCIRLTPSNISALKTYYDGKMANKKDRSTAHLTVNY